MNNPIKNLSRKEWLIWIGSLVIVFISNILSGDLDWLTLLAAMIGVTSLIFAAKGNVWAQILMIVFSILYGIENGSEVAIQKLRLKHWILLIFFGTGVTIGFYFTSIEHA